MPNNENKPEKKGEDKTVDKSGATGMDMNEGQTENGTVGGTGSDLEESTSKVNESEA